MTKNKSKPLTLLGASLLIGTMNYAQNIAPQSVNSCGTKMSQANSNLSFTVGELIVSTQADTQGNTLGAGFTPAATITTMSIQETDPALIDVRVFPNPTSELINIQINHSTLDQVLITISNLQGKEVYVGRYAAISNVIRINTAAYAPSTYILYLKNSNNQLLGTYKIIKH